MRMGALHAASYAGDVKKIRLALQAGEEVDSTEAVGTTAWMSSGIGPDTDDTDPIELKNNDGKTALMIVSSTGHQRAVRVLLDAGATVNSVDKSGATALMYAGEKGHTGVMRLLMVAGADVETVDNGGSTAMVWASTNGHGGAVRTLLEAGVAVDAVARGCTALVHASMAGHVSAMRALLEAGASVDFPDFFGQTALVLAGVYGEEAAVRALLEAGAAVDSRGADGKTTLTLAREHGHAGVMRLLLEAGAAVGSIDTDGKGALLWPVANRQGVNPLGLLTLLLLLCLGLPLLCRRLCSPGSAPKRKNQRQKTKRAAPVLVRGARSGPARSGETPPSQPPVSQAATAVATGAGVAARQRAAARQRGAAKRGPKGALRVDGGASHSSGGADERGGAEAERGAAVALDGPPPVVPIAAEEVLRALEAAGSDGEVGDGGFGKVFAAELPSLAARWGRVAVKIASGLHAADILLEVETLRLCRHRNVLPLLGYCDDARAPCMITPLMHGGSLDDRLLLSGGALERLRRLDFEGDARLDWQLRLSALCDAARGLAHLHGERILHRDVKTANILLEGALRPLPMARGQPLLVHRAVLIDVGLAKVREPTLGGTTTHATTRNLAFSTGFGDPALLNSNQHSEKTDAFGIGVCILMSLVSEPAAGLMKDHDDDVCDAMEDGAGSLHGTAHAVAGWPSNATRVLAALVHGLSIATTRRRQPLPEALVQMEALLGPVGEAAGGEEATVVGAASAVSRPLASSCGASMPPVQEDEPDARAAASAQPMGWSGGELTRMVRQLEVGDADASLARKRERVTKAYDSMMVWLERAYAGQGHAPLPTGEQELRKIDLLAPRHLGRLNGLAHTLRKWWNSAKHERDQWAHPPSDEEVQRLVRDVIAELDGLCW